MIISVRTKFAEGWLVKKAIIIEDRVGQVAEHGAFLVGLGSKSRDPQSDWFFSVGPALSYTPPKLEFRAPTDIATHTTPVRHISLPAKTLEEKINET